jgi:hypothetical protein
LRDVAGLLAVEREFIVEVDVEYVFIGVIVFLDEPIIQQKPRIAFLSVRIKQLHICDAVPIRFDLKTLHLIIIVP